jgi:hypothetical protein
MTLFEKKMKDEGLSDAAVAAFKSNFEKLVAGEDGIVRTWASSPCSACGCRSCRALDDAGERR